MPSTREEEGPGGVENFTLALLKGRMFPEVRELLRRARLPGVESLREDRCACASVGGWRYLLVRPGDVVTYVREGVADAGLVGKDVLLEDGEGVYELLDLSLGVCRLSVAGPAVLAGEWEDLLRSRGDRLRVATRYPRVTLAYFARLGYHPRVVRLGGAVELAPLVGLADVIVDLVATGRTLREHGLAEYASVAPITTRLVVNPVSFRWKARAVEELRARLLEARGEDARALAHLR